MIKLDCEYQNGDLCKEIARMEMVQAGIDVVDKSEYECHGGFRCGDSGIAIYGRMHGWLFFRHNTLWRVALDRSMPGVPLTPSDMQKIANRRCDGDPYEIHWNDVDGNIYSILVHSQDALNEVAKAIMDNGVIND